ncbi:MAG TPA: DUF58 domain-containing protein [Acidimicrobiales bacterium]|nr:DUF58 domain-containing protein [Acidimicrobiales bacterium]
MREVGRDRVAAAGAGGTGARLLDPGLLARLESLQLGTRRRLAGHFAGEHRSTRHGASPDFADYRQYHPGDDFRRIDYFLYARLDVLLLKLYEAEDDLHLRLLVDTSASMGIAGKLDMATRVAAALGFVALTRRDPVTVHTFPLHRAAPRFAGRAAVPALFGHLGGLDAGGDTNFAAAVSSLLARPGPAGLTVVVSDLLTEEWEGALSRLPSRGGDVMIVHVLAGEELHPTLLGDLELIDREGGGRVIVSLAADSLAAYEQATTAWLERVRGRCAHVGAAYVRILAEDDLESALLGAWRREGVLR